MIAYDQFGNLRAPMKGAKSAVKREERDASRAGRAAAVRRLRRARPGEEHLVSCRTQRRGAFFAVRAR
jgi:hypothetical protein